MSASDPLTGPMMKLERAWRHLEDFEATVVRWRESSPYRVVEKFNPQRNQYVVRATITKQLSDFDPFAPVMVGDCVHNMRSALDNAVYELASLHRRRVKDNSGFPIFGTEYDFLCKGVPMIAALPELARAYIQTVQPYHGPDFVRDRLSVLNTLWNTDKHRRIPLLSVVPTTWLLDIKNGPAADVLPIRYDRRDPGEVIAYIQIRKDANVDFQPSLALGVGFSEPRKAQDWHVEISLMEMHHVVRDVVLPALAPFFL